MFKEYPHTGFRSSARRNWSTLVLKAIRGEIKPVMSLYDCRMIGVFPTSREPRRTFVDKMQALEGQDGVLSVSLAHGFP